MLFALCSLLFVFLFFVFCFLLFALCELRAKGVNSVAENLLKSNHPFSEEIICSTIVL
jgi:hypothetical protein